MITLQSIFNLAWQKFVVEKLPPCVDGDVCMYTKGDNHCAIGWSLPADALRHLGERSMGFGRVVTHYPKHFHPDIHHMSYDDLNEFQSDLHDEIQQSGKWITDVEVAYRNAAAKYSLCIPGEGVPLRRSGVQQDKGDKAGYNLE